MDVSFLNPFATKTANKISHYQFLTKGVAGDIECLLSIPLAYENTSTVAIICHPHPLHGGSMNNKVVHTMAKTFNKNDIPVFRFNFRSVERSQGKYDNGVGEKEDLRIVTNLAESIFPNRDLCLAGFSFGSYIAFSMQARLNASQLITIAPAVTSFNFDTTVSSQCTWLLVQGLADEVVEADKVLDWANHLQNPPIIITMENTSHFFHGRLIDLANTLQEHLF